MYVEAVREKSICLRVRKNNKKTTYLLTHRGEKNVDN